MFYTLTLNPAIDLFIDMDELIPKKVNRSNYEDYQENGKGVNVSRILHRLGIENVALGFIAGFTGKFIEEQLNKEGIKTDFIEVDGITRINVFLNAETEYKVVNKGPVISEEKREALLVQLKNLNEGDFLFVCGSLPRGIDFSIYEEIAKICHEKKVKLILDTSTKQIVDYLHYGIHLIKPNDEELASFFGIEHTLSDDEIEKYAKKLVEMGCEKVLVSCGEKGAIYFDKNNLVAVNAPQGVVVNTACSGDTLLATFIGKLYLGEDIEKALSYASASASSTAFTEGITDFKNVSELLKQVKVLKKN